MNALLDDLADPVGFDEILANAKMLRPQLAERSDEIEEGRRLPSDLVEKLREAGCFRMNMPRMWGGPELTSMEQVLVIEELSKGDASVGWCVMIGCDSGVYSGYLDDDAARDLYPHVDVIQAGWVYPMGRADETSEGYRVSGNWRFCSGSSHTDMIAAGCTVFRDGQPLIGDNGSPEWRLVLAPVAHWKINDIWRTTGLRGTASNDYTTLTPVMMVPREHTFSFSEPRRQGNLWKRPDTILRKMAGIPLGVSRRLIDEATLLLSRKTEPLTGRPLKNHTRIKSAIAESEMLLGAARSYVFAALETQWTMLDKDQELTLEVRRDVWLSRLNAFQRARDIARLLYDVVGGSAIYSQNGPYDRGVRDTETMCQHLVGQLRTLEDVGGMLLNSDNKSGSPML